MAEAQKSRLTFAHVEEGATTARAGKNAGNPYLPEVATVKEIVQETPNIKSLRVTFDDAEVMENFSFAPGQVGQLGVFGVGESTFAINSSPYDKDYLQFSVMKAGEVTTALHDLTVGIKWGSVRPWVVAFRWRNGRARRFCTSWEVSAPLRCALPSPTPWRIATTTRISP